MAHNSPVPGSNGDHYIPFDQRTGDKSVVYFTRDLSAQGLVNHFPPCQRRPSPETWP